MPPIHLNVGLHSHPPCQPILQAFHPTPLPPVSESISALTTKAVTAATETNRGRCFNSTGTRRRYPIPIEGGAGHERSPPACSCMQGRWWWCGRLGAGCMRGRRVSKYAFASKGCKPRTFTSGLLLHAREVVVVQTAGCGVCTCSYHCHVSIYGRYPTHLINPQR